MTTDHLEEDVFQPASVDIGHVTEGKSEAEIDELLDWTEWIREPTPLIYPQNLEEKTCTAKEYVENLIFPTLLPGLERMLLAAEKNLVFERKRTKFNACDFLTEYLYQNNPKHKRREAQLHNIPFVQKILSVKPRPPLPLSLQWSESEAAVVIQSFWRGFVVRKDPKVQELRQYQREMRQESCHITLKMEEFWKKHPVESPR